MKQPIPSSDAQEQERTVLLLIQKSREGDLNAFGELVRLYREKAYGLALSYLKHPQDAEDVSQEAFIKAFEKLKSYDSALGPFGAWLLKITANLAKNKLRWKGIRNRWTLSLDREGSATGEDDAQPMQVPDSDPASDPAVSADNLLQKEAIDRALAVLPEQQRTVLHLKFALGYKISEISGILGIAEGTVKSHLFRGMETLKRTLGENT